MSYSHFRHLSVFRTLFFCSKALAVCCLLVGATSLNSAEAASDTKEVKASASKKIELSADKADKKDDEQGFESLLGEKAKDQWRGYADKSWPKNWKLEEGVLTRVADGGDVMTTEKFTNFELRLDWKISPGGNSGILYRVATGDDQPYYSGLEYQVFDEGDRKKGMLTTASALYALYPPTEVAINPVGKWNTARIVVAGNHIEHWVNGKKVVECEVGSDDWNQRLAKSKFSTWKNFNKNATGHLSLQDHGHSVWYRNIRIKRLAEKK